ncbi:Gti1/Pac2 family-domain-containing protein [Apiospora arundinis]
MSDRVLGGAMPHHHRHLSAGAILQPTFVGYISSTVDALVLFEACLTGHTSHVPRLPHDLERANLIRSGNVFIYEENSSGIKRWTDGVSWSPSRILRNFLLYRELDKPFQPGEKRAMEQTDKSIGVTQPTSTSLANAVGSSSVDMGGLAFQYSDASGNDKDTEKALGEPLVDSYQIKPNGLVKKTTSVQYRGIIHHLVSYYNIDDVVGKKLRTPMEFPELQRITPRTALISAVNFRAPVDNHIAGSQQTCSVVTIADNSKKGYTVTKISPFNRRWPDIRPCRL